MGAHIGHSHVEAYDSVSYYLLGTRNFFVVFDLYKTIPFPKNALVFLERLVSQFGNVPFRYSGVSILNIHIKSFFSSFITERNQSFSYWRWAPGCITNYKSVSIRLVSHLYRDYKTFFSRRRNSSFVFDSMYNRSLLGSIRDKYQNEYMLQSFITRNRNIFFRNAALLSRKSFLLSFMLLNWLSKLRKKDINMSLRRRNKHAVINGLTYKQRYFAKVARQIHGKPPRYTEQVQLKRALPLMRGKRHIKPGTRRAIIHAVQRNRVNIIVRKNAARIRMRGHIGKYFTRLSGTKHRTTRRHALVSLRSVPRIKNMRIKQRSNSHVISRSQRHVHGRTARTTRLVSKRYGGKHNNSSFRNGRDIRMYKRNRHAASSRCTRVVTGASIHTYYDTVSLLLRRLRIHRLRSARWLRIAAGSKRFRKLRKFYRRRLSALSKRRSARSLRKRRLLHLLLHVFRSRKLRFVGARNVHYNTRNQSLHRKFFKSVHRKRRLIKLKSATISRMYRVLKYLYRDRDKILSRVHTRYKYAPAKGPGIRAYLFIRRYTHLLRYGTGPHGSKRLARNVCNSHRIRHSRSAHVANSAEITRIRKRVRNTTKRHKKSRRTRRWFNLYTFRNRKFFGYWYNRVKRKLFWKSRIAIRRNRKKTSSFRKLPNFVSLPIRIFYITKIQFSDFFMDESNNHIDEHAYFKSLYSRFMLFWRAIISFRCFKKTVSAPDCLVFLNPDNQLAQFNDFSGLNVPVISISDSNSYLAHITYFVPSNDDSPILLLFYFPLFINARDSGMLRRYTPLYK
jgi:ribosomal protein S2